MKIKIIELMKKKTAFSLEKIKAVFDNLFVKHFF